jgi:hypothetical protein
MTYWREAGLTYLQFSRIAASLVRRAVKKDKPIDVAAREATFIKRIGEKKA